jgi:hypothetical protein
MAGDLTLSARDVASMIARIFGPAIYDTPKFGGDPFRIAGIAARVAGPHPDPWRAGPSPDPWMAVMLNPQPLPPKERYAVALAEAHILDLVAIDRLGSLFGEAEERGAERAMATLAEIDDLCPRWPRWPKGWPPPPPPPWGDEEMEPAQLFLFGISLLAAVDQLDSGRLQEGVTQLGEKMLSLAMPG